MRLPTKHVVVSSANLGLSVGDQPVGLAGGEAVDSWAIYRMNFRADGSRLDPSSYIHAGQIRSVLAGPSQTAGRNRPIIDPDDISAASSRERQPRLQKVGLPPCRDNGSKCMYDRSKLVPAPRRVMGR